MDVAFLPASTFPAIVDAFDPDCFLAIITSPRNLKHSRWQDYYLQGAMLCLTRPSGNRIFMRILIASASLCGYSWPGIEEQGMSTTSYAVVTFWQDRSGDGRKGSYDYQHHGDLNAALDSYREYQDGEFARATAVGIFEARNGLPIGEAISPARLLQLIQETRAAA